MWPYFCEHLRHCGRNGAPFFFVFTGVIGAVSTGPWGGVLFLALLGGAIIWFCAAVAAQRDKCVPLGKLPPLSNHDWRAARARLKPHSSPRRQG